MVFPPQNRAPSVSSDEGQQRRREGPGLAGSAVGASSGAHREARSVQWAVDGVGEPVDRPGPRHRNQPDGPAVTRLEPDGGTGGDVEVEPAGCGPVELQGPVRLEEMEVRADLDRPVAGVGDLRLEDLAALVAEDGLLRQHILTRNHGRSRYRIGSWTVTSFVPSGNVASTWTSGIISGIPSITSSRVRIVVP